MRIGLKVANIFHAGDGNLHPLIMFDANDPGELPPGGAIRRRHPEAVRRGRRLPDRRAWRRRGEARTDAGAVQRGRTRPAAPHQGGLRSGLAAQPEQGVSRAVGGIAPFASRMRQRPSRRPRFSGRGRMTTSGPAEEERSPPRSPQAAGEAAADRTGNGTKAGMLRPVQAARTLSTRNLTGITLYSPNELVISARAGTPLAEIEATLAEHGQHIIAEPPDLAAIYRRARAADTGRRGRHQPVRPAPRRRGARCATTCWASARSPGTAR